MESKFDESLLQRVTQCGVVAVLVIDEVQHAVPVARALLAGGVTAMELTLRTPAAIEALMAIRSEVPEILAGIGTVLTPDQVRRVAEADAQFAVAPGCNPTVIKAAEEIGLPFAPGIATPTDIEMAVELGCRELKFFPAEPGGGLPYLKSMAAPYNHLGLRYIPLGGINAQNLGTYLAEKLILAVGGSWLATRELIQQQNWAEITTRAAAAQAVVRKVREDRV